MIVKKKINKNESLIYLKKVKKFLVVSNENLKLIEAYSNKSTNDFKIYLKNIFPKNADEIEKEINKLFTVERKSIDNHKTKINDLDSKMKILRIESEEGLTIKKFKLN